MTIRNYANAPGANTFTGEPQSTNAAITDKVPETASLFDLTNRPEDESHLLPPHRRLTPTDLTGLQGSWISSDAAKRAGIYRVDGADGACMVGREKDMFTEKHAGLCFPITHLSTAMVRRCEGIE